VGPEELKTNYPNSDIIVFHRPDKSDELIVHRIVPAATIGGKSYFFTKGDGNPTNTWPSIPEPYEYDRWYSKVNIPLGAVSEDLVVGKVVIRVPWIGQIALLMNYALGINNSYLAVATIVGLVILLLFMEFVTPIIRR
jgi:hypothetical protein